MKNKLRNLVLALVCLAVFAALGVFLYSTWVVQRPFSVIVFLCPNLDPPTFAAARLFAGGTRARLSLEMLEYTALVRNSSNDAATADPAAAASAAASGAKTNNGKLSVAPTGEVLATLLELARVRGRGVGLVTNGSVVSPTLAAFFAPGADAENAEQLALILLENARPDLVLGGGEALLLPELKGGARKDGRDLMLEARQGGYDIVRNRSELESTPSWRAPKLFGIFAGGDLPFAGQFEAAGPQPSLAVLVRRAIQLLQFNRQGYFLVVDAALAGRAAATGSGENLLREILELDRAVATAIEYAGEDTLIIVAGTASLGGFRLTPGGFPGDSGIAVLGKSPAGVPAGSWATGPGSPSAGGTAQEPVAFPTSAPLPTAGDMLVFGHGKLANPPCGFIDNTQIFTILREGL